MVDTHAARRRKEARMRLGSTLVIGAALVLGMTGASFAGKVNCKQVNKYLQTGRSVKDVAETMVIDESDVKKCQEEAASEGAAGGEKGGQKAPEAGSKDMK
jgi:hypothetical protein